MSVSTFIARRYLRSKKSSSAVGIISLVSIFGVGVAVFALFVVLSVFSALRQLNASYMSMMDPDIRIRPTEGKFFAAPDSFKQKIFSDHRVQEASFILQDKVFISYGDKQLVALMVGVDSSYCDVIGMDTLIAGGTWLTPDKKNEVVVGAKMAYELGLGSSEEYVPLTAYVPSGETELGFSAANLFKSIDMDPVGIFSYREYDGSYVFTDISTAREFLGRRGADVSSVELKLRSGINADKSAKDLSEILGENYVVTTRAQQQQMYFKIVNTENIVLYSVFTIVLLIAMFNVVGSVVMLIIDKRSDVRTLHSMGASTGDIKKIFIKEGMMVVLVGGMVGLLLGVVAVLTQQSFPFIRMSTGSMLPYPILFTFENLILVALTIIVLAYGCARLSVLGIKNILGI